MSAIETVGMIGGFVSCSAILPQIYKSYRLQATKDLSWTMFGVFYVGVFMNLIFGFMISHPAVYLTAMYSLITNSFLLSLKIYYDVLMPRQSISQTGFVLSDIRIHEQNPSHQRDSPNLPLSVQPMVYRVNAPS